MTMYFADIQTRQHGGMWFSVVSMLSVLQRNFFNSVLKILLQEDFYFRHFYSATVRGN